MKPYFARGTLWGKLTGHNCSVSAKFVNECFLAEVRFGSFLALASIATILIFDIL